MNNTKGSEDKRRYERFPNKALKLTFAKPGIRGIFSAKPSTECTNFSRTGLQFDCTTELMPGEKLLIDIELEEISLRELKAEVVTRQTSPGGDWCYGVRFCLEDTSKSHVFHALLMIEDRLKTIRDLATQT